MSLRQIRDQLSVLQVVIAVTAVAAGGGVRWYAVASAVALSGLAFARPLPAVASRRTQRAWTLLVFVALVASAVRAIARAEFLDAGIDFLLLLVVQRFFNRQRAREHMQLLMLGSLLMVVGAVINTGLSYPILFAAYVGIAVFALMVNHLLSEGERLGPRVALEVQRQAVGSRRFLLRSTLSISLLAGVGAAVVFVAFPRWGVGVFMRGQMAADALSGFSGQVQLGGFGRIKNDPTVAMRLRPIDPVTDAERLTWYLRGSSFDRYAAGEWSHTRRSESLEHQRNGSWTVIKPASEQGFLPPRSLSLEPIAGFSASTRTVRAEVTLEDLGVDVVFAASDPIAVHLRPRGPLERRARLRAGKNREVRIDKLPGPLQYEFLSRIGQPTPEELEAVGRPPVTPDLQAFLQGRGQVSKDVTDLARDLTAGETTRFAKVDAIMDHLAGFEYSLELLTSQRVEAGADPLEGFLFDHQAGHCEYFATAMAVLLREVGVPTRIVNGYYGGHRNELGEFYAVRQADAHSWVEVHFGPLGWITFDPTPPSGRIAGDDAALWPAGAQVVDALRNAYLEYVIDYNLGKQLALLENIGLRREREHARPRIAWSLVFVGFVTLGAAAWFGRSLRLRRRTAVPVEVRIYERVLARLAAAGWIRGPTESPLRFAARMRAVRAEPADAFERFAKLYEPLRFGTASADEAQLEQLRDAAAAVEQSLGST